MGGCQWFGKSTIFKLVGQGGLSKKATKVQEDSRCKEYRENIQSRN